MKTGQTEFAKDPLQVATLGSARWVTLLPCASVLLSSTPVVCMYRNCVLISGRGLQALSMTNSEFQKLFSNTAAGFFKLFSNLGANAGNLAGPVGVMQMGTEASKQVGPRVRAWKRMGSESAEQIVW